MKSSFDAVALFLTAGFVFAPGLGAQVSKPPVFDAQHAAPPFGRELILLMLWYPNGYAEVSGEAGSR
jgi:hypothetical protein